MPKSQMTGCRYPKLEIDADLGADHEGVGDVPGATRPDDVLHVRLEKERPVFEPKGVVPLQDRLLLLDTDSSVEALGQPLGAPQVATESPVKDAKAGDIPRALWKDAAGENGGLKEQWHLTTIL